MAERRKQYVGRFTWTNKQKTATCRLAYAKADYREVVFNKLEGEDWI